MRADEVLTLAPVMPVVTIDDVAHAAPMARALTKGGLRTIELTLRTPVALEAIRTMVREAPDAVVGAGTVLNETDYRNAIDAGAAYALSPGATPALLKAAKDGPIPLIPGLATASELMVALEFGYTCVKFFPAARLGGPAALKDLGGPLPTAKFCATGGIGPDDVEKYLALANVPCVGGSWVAPADKVKAGDWAGIEALARKAAAFRKS